MNIIKIGWDYSFTPEVEDRVKCEVCGRKNITTNYVKLKKKLQRFIPEKHRHNICCFCWRTLYTNNLTIDDIICCGDLMHREHDRFECPYCDYSFERDNYMG